MHLLPSSAVNCITQRNVGLIKASKDLLIPVLQQLVDVLESSRGADQALHKEAWKQFLASGLAQIVRTVMKNDEAAQVWAEHGWCH